MLKITGYSWQKTTVSSKVSSEKQAFFTDFTKRRPQKLCI